MTTTDEAVTRPAMNATRMILGIDFLRCAWRSREVSELCAVIERLRALPLPPAYVDGLQDELLQMVGGTMVETTPYKVYLAFYGLGGRAEFMKVGIAKRVGKRLGSLSTGSPMPRLCAYAVPIGTRKQAMRVEAKLLAHMGPDRSNGEWVKVGIPAGDARILVETLEAVAEDEAGRPITFEPVS